VLEAAEAELLALDAVVLATFVTLEAALLAVWVAV
jgi:hypothetical protein